MASYRLTGYAVGLMLLNSIFFLTYFLKSIISLFKCKFKCLEAYTLFFMSPTFLIAWLKIDFEYYHFYYHLFYFTILIGLILFLHKSNRDYIQSSKIILFTLLLNICILSINDYYIFKFWNNDKISWSEQKIEWENYEQLVPSDNNDINAITTNGLQWKISKIDNTPSLIVIGFMKPSESWDKENYKTNRQLSHEQLYLDICELHARKIRKIFSENKYGIDENGTYLTLKNVTENSSYYEMKSVSEGERVIRNIMANKNEMNNSYMIETEHGQSEEKQLDWESIIIRNLKELEEYKR
jgi:hypothetical protein